MRRRLYHWLRYHLPVGGAHLLCRVGLHHWVTISTYFEHSYEYPEKQFCNRQDCDVQRRWRHPYDGWQYYDYPL